MSEAPVERRRYTPEEYFALEEASEIRHEYVDGEIIAMAGETDSHSVINANVIAGLHAATQSGGCRPMSPNMQIRYGAKRRYGYADTVVVCGERKYEQSDAKRRTLLNPTLIVEILSDSTERFNRGAKFSYYREIESFREYVLISQDQPRVETFLRQDDGTWRFASFDGIDAVVPLTSIGVQLTARQIYRDVAFPPPEPDDA
jgi:Uma2 family endonuclease